MTITEEHVFCIHKQVSKQRFSITAVHIYFEGVTSWVSKFPFLFHNKRDWCTMKMYYNCQNSKLPPQSKKDIHQN